MLTLRLVGIVPIQAVFETQIGTKPEVYEVGASTFSNDHEFYVFDFLQFSIQTFPYPLFPLCFALFHFTRIQSLSVLIRSTCPPIF